MDIINYKPKSVGFASAGGVYSALRSNKPSKFLKVWLCNTFKNLLGLFDRQLLQVIDSAQVLMRA
jgi:hypothetical protein